MTGERNWKPPSGGVGARTAADLEAEALLGLDERNGYALLDFDRRSARVRCFGTPADAFAPSTLQVDEALAFELAGRDA